MSAALLAALRGASSSLIEQRAGGLRSSGIASTGEERGVGGAEALRMLRESKHLQIIALVIAFAAIGANLIEQQLNMAAEAFKGREQVDGLTQFLGTVQLYTSSAGFLIQIFLTSRIHRQLGHRLRAADPAGQPRHDRGDHAVVCGAVGAGAGARARHLAALHRRQDDARDSVPAAAERVEAAGQAVRRRHRGSAGAKASSALLALVLISPWGFNLTWQQLSYASLVVMRAVDLHGHPRASAATSPRSGTASSARDVGARGGAPARWPTSRRSRRWSASWPIPTSAASLYAIDVLESLDKRNLVTPLLLYHESPRVRARALTALAAAPRELASKWRTNVRRMLGDEHAEVRAAAVARAGGDRRRERDRAGAAVPRPTPTRDWPRPRRW